MNPSQFTDKQVAGLSGSQNVVVLDLVNPQEEELNGGGDGAKKEPKEDVPPSYDFQPIRPVGAPQSFNLEERNVGGTGGRNLVDPTSDSSNLRTYGSLDIIESAKITQEKDRNAYHSEIDQTIKKHADNLLHVLEGVSTRLSQLESRIHHLESSVDDLKASVGNNHGNTDGKLGQLKNILREVQMGVQVLRDKQEIAEAQLQLAKLQASERDQQSENKNTTAFTDSVQQAASSSQQSHRSLPPTVAFPPPPQQHPALPHPIAPPPPSTQNIPSLQLPIQLPQSQVPSIPQREPYFPPPQQPQPPPPAPQHYQSVSQLPQYARPAQSSQQHPPVGLVNPSPQLQPQLSHHPEETPYMPPQRYPPSIHQLPSMTQQPSGPPLSQKFYSALPHMYEPSSSRSSSEFPSGYSPPSGTIFSDSYPYGGSPAQHGSSTMKLPQVSSSSSTPSGGSSYPRLPTAQILPHALPTASSDGDGSCSGGTGNRVPIDDVIDKVVMMGFSMEQARATVRSLTENGQSVDVNVVLDKLMNDGGVQPQKGWFRR